ncbi:MAG: hypothetical protein ACJ79R_22575 [Anaeromyxobacteraceae bacterium]
MSAKSAAATTSAATPGSLDLGNGIVIDRVRVAIRKVKLEGAVDAADAGADGGADDPANHALVAAAKGGADDAGSGDGGVDDHGGQGLGGDDDADEIRVGPFLVDLTGDALATGGLSKVFDGVVPPGTYRELKVVVDVVPPALAGADAGLADMNGKSVIIDGKLDGTAFSFTSSLHAEAKRETTLVVGASTANVTLTVDPGAWFKAADGSRLDPSAPASKPQIEANIKASVDAFDDDDHDGRDDHGGHGADDGAGHT